MWISPSLISSSPATIRKVVVLPHPEGPTMHHQLTVRDLEVERRRRHACRPDRPCRRRSGVIDCHQPFTPAGEPADQLALREEVEEEDRREGDHDPGENQVPLGDVSPGERVEGDRNRLVARCRRGRSAAMKKSFQMKMPMSTATVPVIGRSSGNTTLA